MKINKTKKINRKCLNLKTEEIPAILKKKDELVFEVRLAI